MRPDLVESFAAEGALPAIADLLENGAAADDGLLAPFPATTGTSLPTLLTGAWPAEHGIVGDRFFRTGSPDFADFANWNDPGLIQADTLPQAAERAGKHVVSVGWEGISALDPAIERPGRRRADPYSQAGVVTNVDLLDQPANADGSASATTASICGRPMAGRRRRSRSARPRRPTSPSARSMRRDRIRTGTSRSTSTTQPTTLPRTTTAFWWRRTRMPPPVADLAAGRLGRRPGRR